MTQQDLEDLHNVPIQSCNPDQLADLKNISIDRSQPVQKRIQSFLSAAGNPYLFKVGAVVVKVSFNPSGKHFQDALADIANFPLMD